MIRERSGVKMRLMPVMQSRTSKPGAASQREQIQFANRCSDRGEAGCLI